MLELWNTIPSIYKLAILFSFLISLGLLISRLRETEENYFPYKRKLSVMTRREQEFFRKLEAEYGQQYYIFPQINLDKLIEPLSHEHKYRNKIDRKSVDFILVNKNTLETELVIELDDSTHFRFDRIQRDAFVEELFESCKIPIKRFNNY